MHPYRLTKRIFEWDWLKKNNNWSEDILHLLNKLDMADLFYNQNYCDLKKLKLNYMNHTVEGIVDVIPETPYLY